MRWGVLPPATESREHVSAIKRLLQLECDYSALHSNASGARLVMPWTIAWYA
jgi:hypothetical protein